jgi:signal transduction histidine kinase
MKTHLTKFLRHTGTSFILVASFLVVTAGFIYYAQTTLLDIEQTLPVTVLEQERDIALLIQNTSELVSAVQLARVKPSPGNIDNVQARLMDVDAHLKSIRSSYNFDNLIGASAIHAVADPALADIKVWLSVGIYGFSPDSLTILTMVETRSMDALVAMKAHFKEARETASDILKEQWVRIDEFRFSIILVLMVLAALGALLVFHVFRGWKSEAALHKAHDELEQRVEERTQSLTEEIQERRMIEAQLLDRTELLQLVSLVTIIANKVELSNDSLEICLEKICAYTGWQVGHVYTVSPTDPDKLVPSDIWYLEGHNRFSSFREITEKTEFRKGVGLPGRVLANGKPEWIEDVTKDDNFPRAKQGKDIGVRAGIGMPIKIGGTVVAVMEFFSAKPVKLDELFLQSLEQIGTQIGRIHERAEANKNLLEAKDKAETANRAKSDFLSSMSHELRTPLNAIIGFSESLKREIFGSVGGDKNREYLDDIYHSGQHLLDLINDVLDVSAIEAGALELHEENVSLAELVDASIHFIKPQAEDGKVTLTSSIDTQLPLIYGDKRRVKQIVLNLLSNAAKFTPEGGRISVSARLNDDGSLSLIVADTGVGMNKEEIVIALSRFEQVDSGLDRKHEGTGLGLPLTKGLMEQHGGILEIKSVKDHGTSITATFPKERVDQNAR